MSPWTFAEYGTGPWHVWYAWRPVKIVDPDLDCVYLIWRERVFRRKRFDRDGSSEWEYALI